MIDCIKKQKGFTRYRTAPGFTLIELLIVIAVLGILAAGVIAAINPVAKINSANLAKAETFAASVQNSLAINLVGEWTFDEEIQGSAKDTSGYGNNGTVNGPILDADRRGRANRAYSFDGVDDYVQIADSNALDATNEITVEAWFYTKRDFGATGRYHILTKELSTANYILRNDERTNDEGGPGLAFTASFNNGGNYYGVGKVIPTTNEWHHVVGVFDTKKRGMELWLDGKLVQNRTDVLGLTMDSNNALVGIGSYPYGPSNRSFNGFIDDVRIYKQAFSLSQIQQLYAQGLKEHRLAIRQY
ncbi:MAG: hypothetical protein A3B47_01770 [Candidatus Levybacteria bacterium RIFCSPLOWO2_01_FULL_39_24]|nr:MAG: hypothetical protein A2800_00305 [Candidatus Levybacteria bacterium RIFCSPHIGHO2_01_FULL_40_16]OGH27920.1 MAG: hypothetical protein A3E12_02230 [Candidatus Levybacteria bacterium RIFCSPHIGHO2_12_FULL_39_9]OGH46844.1 MAG: hypothetical protein A3B47_01770 [Candidatus Levybacteria bacterium RIFCSPLOWO2_01_FULL_39_24]